MNKKQKNDKSLENRETNLENQLKRVLADYQNLEKRISEEKSNWIRTANKDLVLKLLPVLDNLFLAQKHIQDEGLDLSIRKFLDVLAEEGIQRIKTENAEFDPRLMECVSVQEVDPSAGSVQMENKVLEEVRAGFILNNETLRPAQVIVGKS